MKSTVLKPNWIHARLAAAVCLALTSLAGAAEVSFNRDVRPILSDRCFKCHGPDAANQDSEFRVDKFDNATVDLGGYFGIVPGDLAKSEFHVRIHDNDDPMPPAGSLKRLSDADKETLDQWILEGAKFESHWAFEPLPAKVDTPKQTDLGGLVNWVKGPIDQFIAKALVENELTPAKPASKNKWLRRVTFDLTGLPPTENEISEYVSDTSADADDIVIDRLLTSDAYAERMTSEWLDVARYADSYGFQRDDERFVWPYRDWVIKAFQTGMPYDEFITWQLAGDLLPNATREQKLATTFNRLHSHKKEGGVAIEEFRVENVADRTHTVGTAMMGLIQDLKNHGLLEDTLVIWGGEFGRTSYCQGKITPGNFGRDHHPRCFTMWMAGGGVKPGHVHGETDEFSYNVVSDGVHIHDLHATILHQMGIDHERLTYRYQGRDFRLTDVHGHVVKGLIA
ncbi:DUF1549 domain-containing protein [Rubripirellula reticaptiva]|nr:DUF1549 domain-containing protein [Rubripirellula reticaptiva]